MTIKIKDTHIEFITTNNCKQFFNMKEYVTNLSIISVLISMYVLIQTRNLLIRNTDKIGGDVDLRHCVHFTYLLIDIISILRG